MKSKYLTAISILTFALASIHLFIGTLLAQNKAAYIIPDIGTPGMNVYIELLADAYSTGAFGSASFVTDSSLYLTTASENDKWKIQFSPLYISWNGRLITTQAFIHPNLNPTSYKWSEGINIPIALMQDGKVVNTFDFYVVRPFHIGDISEKADTVFGEGSLGIRSPRGAMIVDSLILGNKRYTVSTKDCDSRTEGNQGYLPFTLTVLGAIIGKPSTVIAVDGLAQNGGPGGGGGGGAFSDNIPLFTGKDINSPDLKGGAGFTGGGPGGINGSLGVYSRMSSIGVGTGNDSISTSGGSYYDYAGGSLNGLRGAHVGAHESAGGGTGHPFGMSGGGSTNGYTHEETGGYGSGSGGTQGTPGGNGTYLFEGTELRLRDGYVNGNLQLVPLAGGSGGASGNPQGPGTYSGYGGGGGGAIAINAKIIENISISAKGANGQGSPANVLFYGGSGSGGGVLLTSKLVTNVNDINVNGGWFKPANSGDTAKAGQGVYRNDAFNSPTMIGSAIDTTKYVNKLSITRITGRTQSNSAEHSLLYIKSENGEWKFLDTVDRDISGYWSYEFTPEFWQSSNDTVYYLYLVIAKPPSVTSEVKSSYADIPLHVLSQAAANVIIVTELPEPHIELVDNWAGQISLCDTTTSTATHEQVQSVWNSGEADLIFDVTKSSNTLSWVFNIEGTNGFPIIPPGDTTVLYINYVIPPGVAIGTYTDTISIWHNDSLRQNPWIIINKFSLEKLELTVEPTVIDLGTVYLTASWQDTTLHIINNFALPIAFDAIYCNSQHLNYSFDTTKGIVDKGSPFAVVVSYIPNPDASAGGISDTIKIVTQCGIVNCLVFGRLEEGKIETFDTTISLGKIAACDGIDYNFMLKNDNQEVIIINSIKLSGTNTYNFKYQVPNNQALLPGDSIECSVFANDNSFSNVDLTPGIKQATLTVTFKFVSGLSEAINYNFSYEIVPSFVATPSPLNFATAELGDIGSGNVNIEYQPNSSQTVIDTVYLKTGYCFKLDATQSLIGQVVNAESQSFDINIAYEAMKVGTYNDTLFIVFHYEYCSDTLTIPISINVDTELQNILHEVIFRDITICDSTWNDYFWQNPAIAQDILKQGDTLASISSIIGANAEMYTFDTKDGIEFPWVYDDVSSEWYDIIEFYFVVMSDKSLVPDSYCTAQISFEIHKSNGAIVIHTFNLSVNSKAKATAMPNNVDFGSIWLPAGISTTEVVELASSQLPIDLTVFSSKLKNDNFNIVSNFNNRLSSKDKNTATIGIKAEAAGIFEDTLEIVIKYPLCEDTLLVPIRLHVQITPTHNNYTIKLDTITSIDPRASHINLPVHIKSDKYLEAGKIDSIEFLMINGYDMFYPTGVDNNTNSNLKLNTLRAGKDIILTITNVDISELNPNESEVLFNITGIPMLGSAQESEIIFNKKTKFNDATLVGDIREEPGLIRLDICTEGNDRLITNNSLLEIEFINPVTSDYMDLICKTSESGTHWLEIVDNSGMSYTIKQWEVNKLDANEFTFNISVANLPNGWYYLIIHSPNMHNATKMIIAR